MWTFLAKALRYSSSSTWTTVTTTASNFISSVSDRPEGHLSSFCPNRRQCKWTAASKMHFSLLSAGFSRAAYLRRGPDNAVVGRDLADPLRPSGATAGVAAGWPSGRGRQEWMIRPVSTSSALTQLCKKKIENWKKKICKIFLIFRTIESKLR